MTRSSAAAVAPTFTKRCTRCKGETAHYESTKKCVQCAKQMVSEWRKKQQQAAADEPPLKKTAPPPPPQKPTEPPPPPPTPRFSYDDLTRLSATLPNELRSSTTLRSAVQTLAFDPHDSHAAFVYEGLCALIATESDVPLESVRALVTCGLWPPQLV